MGRHLDGIAVEDKKIICKKRITKYTFFFVKMG